MSTFIKYFALVPIVTLLPFSLAAEEKPTRVLSPRNLEAPFCYLVGGTRSWPIFDAALSEGARVSLVAEFGDQRLAGQEELRLPGLRITVADGLLTVEAAVDADLAIQLEVAISLEQSKLESQRLLVRPAPPPRPISYVSDLVDDLIRIFWDESQRDFRPLRRDAFDQYFRRLQAQGISRLVVWQSPFPLIADPRNYDAEDWRRYELQARAILDSKRLTDGMASTAQLKSYQWLRQLMRLRLSSDFDQLYTSSARQHGIQLTASFRPFEAALTKYYVVPTFDTRGDFLWDFLPSASPAVANHPDEVGFAHYREVLRRMDRGEQASLAVIEISGVSQASELVRRAQDGHRDIQLWAAKYPPLDDSALVLARQTDSSFVLQPYGSIRSAARSQQVALDCQLAVARSGALEISGFELPDSHRYLVLRSASDFGAQLELPAILQVVFRAVAGNSLGRANVYCSLAGQTETARRTRVAGIPGDGMYRTGFQAIENSLDYFRQQRLTHWRLGDAELVCDLGSDWSVEMIDFNRPAARRFAVRQLSTILASEAFDEILINTRSHTQLAASSADGPDGVQPLAHYRLRGKTYHHYGIDRAFAPVSVAEESTFRELTRDSRQVAQITDWQAGEWQGPCQTADSPFVWRYERNRAVARGVRLLLQDLESQFPNLRIRVVIPPSAAVENGFQTELETMARPSGGVYGSQYYRAVRGSLNHIPAIGEGMAMIDLSGLAVEPVFLGIRFLPDQAPLQSFMDRCTEDLRRNRGSRFLGPRSFFYEAQETLRGQNRQKKEARRDEIIQYLLSQREQIREVLLYEAADWTYYVALEDPWKAFGRRKP